MQYEKNDERLHVTDMTFDDMGEVAQLARHAWFHSDYHGMQDTVSLFFATQHLQRATLTRVARVDGRIVGVMFANVNGEKVAYSQQARSQIEMLEAELEKHGEGRHFLSVFRGYVCDHEELEREARQNCDAECQMFIVLPQMQGKGIGRVLWDDMIRYFRDCGARSYFLYTDTDCDWQIYERKGLTKTAESWGNAPDGTRYGQFIYVGGV